MLTFNETCQRMSPSTCCVPYFSTKHRFHVLRDLPEFAQRLQPLRAAMRRILRRRGDFSKPFLRSNGFRWFGGHARPMLGTAITTVLTDCGRCEATLQQIGNDKKKKTRSFFHQTKLFFPKITQTDFSHRSSFHPLCPTLRPWRRRCTWLWGHRYPMLR